MKFTSARLKDSNYKLNITLDQARKNNELIRLGDNQILRTLRKVINKPFLPDQLSNLIKEKKKFFREGNDKNHLFEIMKQIDDILFVPQIISVHIDNKAHLRNIYNKGLFINGQSYSRLWAGAGNLRRNIINMIRSDLKDQMQQVLDNGRNMDIPLVPAKHGAYFALFGSSSMEVSFPNICIVKDYLHKELVKVNWVFGEGKNIDVDQRELEIEFNRFDGQGLASQRWMNKISLELGLDYSPSWVICRAPYIKGLLVNFNFHKYSKFVAKKNTIIDIYGNEQNINNIDVLISESQAKLWNCYDSTEQYLENCRKNDLSFGVTRYAPNKEKENKSVFSNYQFNQIYTNFSNNDIESLCQPIIDYIRDLYGKDSNKMLLYLMGNAVNTIGENNWYNSIQDNAVKALMINKQTSFDPFIIQSFSRSLNKTIRESYLGKTLHRGNFSIAMSDPVAQIEHIFGLEVKGLLKKKEYYSEFWNNQNIDKVAVFRAPLTHVSEACVFNIRTDEQLKMWYSNINTGIIFNVYDDTMLRLSSSDFDGDIIMSTDQKEFIDGIDESLLSITYEEKKSDKIPLTNNAVHQSDLNALDTSVGFITNCSSSYWCLLSNYEKGSIEYNEISKRLIALRREQGKQIDKAKSVIVTEFPSHWTRYTKMDFSLSEEERKEIEYQNSFVIKKRPLFFIYLYPHYMKKYRHEIKVYDAYCRMKYGLGLEELINKEDKTEDQLKTINNYYSKSFFLHSKNSIMNRCMWYLQKNIKEIHYNAKTKFDYSLYMNNNIKNDVAKLEEIKNIYKQYNNYRRMIKENSFTNELDFSNNNEFILYLQKECLKFIDDFQELTNLLVLFCYEKIKTSNKSFCWDIVGEQMLENLKNNSDGFINVPIPSGDGEIEYLWSNYIIKEFKLSDLEKEKIIDKNG
jgi:hypothetical protein